VGHNAPKPGLDMPWESQNPERARAPLPPGRPLLVLLVYLGGIACVTQFIYFSLGMWSSPLRFKASSWVYYVGTCAMRRTADSGQGPCAPSSPRAPGDWVVGGGSHEQRAACSSQHRRSLVPGGRWPMGSLWLVEPALSKSGALVF
jgi:hypothetical protein